MMLVVALAVAWLAYSVSATFENWPWTVRHTYRSGNFEGVTIGSTKADAMEQILLRQRQRALESVALIDDAGVLVAQEWAGSSRQVSRSGIYTHLDCIGSNQRVGCRKADTDHRRLGVDSGN
jgi:hypothetical protein